MSYDEDIDAFIINNWKDINLVQKYDYENKDQEENLTKFETDLAQEDSNDNFGNFPYTSEFELKLKEEQTELENLHSNSLNQKYPIPNRMVNNRIMDAPNGNYEKVTKFTILKKAKNDYDTDLVTTSKLRYDQVQLKICNLMKKNLIKELNLIKINGNLKNFTFPNYQFSRDYFQHRISKDELRKTLNLTVEQCLLQKERDKKRKIKEKEVKEKKNNEKEDKEKEEITYLDEDSYESNLKTIELLKKIKSDDAKIFKKTLYDFFYNLNTEDKIKKSLKVNVSREHIKEFLLKSGLQTEQKF